jgi:hypothetical protein
MNWRDAKILKSRSVPKGQRKDGRAPTMENHWIITYDGGSRSARIRNKTYIVN